MQTENYTTINMKQYIELNLRIQKSLIIDFDKETAL